MYDDIIYDYDYIQSQIYCYCTIVFLVLLFLTSISIIIIIGDHAAAIFILSNIYHWFGITQLYQQIKVMYEAHNSQSRIYAAPQLSQIYVIQASEMDTKVILLLI